MAGYFNFEGDVMKKCASLLAAIACTVSLAISSIAAADTVSPPQPAAPTQATSPVIVTALKTTSGVPTFVQLYNNSSDIVDLRGWKLELIATNTTDELDVTLATFSSWLLPNGYVVAGDSTVGGADIIFHIDSATQQTLAGMPNDDFRIVPPTSATTTNDSALSSTTKFTACNSGAGTCTSCTTSSTAAPLAVGQWLQRKQSTSGKYTVSSPPSSSDFCSQTGAASLTGDSLYEPPADTAGLQIVELLPNSSDCSPTDTSLDCGDFVKLFNSSKSPIDLSTYRLRTSYGGNKSTASNTVSLDGMLAPGAYTIVNTKNDGSPLSLTESGGYVWLEDAYGVQLYLPVINYPDASSTTKVGWAWAFDGAGWNWTSDPTTAANDFPASDQASSATTPVSTSSLVPCKPGQERNPLTNRCRTIVSASTLVPCKPDQTRNPATNRCRSVLAASTSASLTPCKAGQERNPATNRCRSISATGSTLKPCQPGWQRNPQTNRCRKTSAASIASVRDVKAAAHSGLQNVGWLITTLVLSGAVAYAAYEWRRDLLLGIDKLKTRLARFGAKFTQFRSKRRLEKLKSQ
jgi:hypothetical protein